MELLFAVLIGIGLSISAGFRVFTPLLVASIMSKLNILQLSEGFEWLGSTPALIAFIIANIVEVICYYIPVIDKFIKALAAPLALGAGTLLTVSIIGVDESPLLAWGLSIITGGGAAAASQLTTTAMRSNSTKSAVKTTSPSVSVIENSCAFTLSIFSILFPLIVAIFIIIVAFVVAKIRNKTK
ncbi:MAG: DUF4126 domain-containing protein [Lysinibacillus sp.]